MGILLKSPAWISVLVCAVLCTVVRNSISEEVAETDCETGSSWQSVHGRQRRSADCETTEDCQLIDANSECDEQSNTCVCKDGHVEYQGQCHTYSDLGEPCQTNHDCWASSLTTECVSVPDGEDGEEQLCQCKDNYVEEVPGECHCDLEVYVEDDWKCWEYEKWTPRNLIVNNFGTNHIRVSWDGPLDQHDKYVVAWFHSKPDTADVYDALTYTITGLVASSWHTLSVYSVRGERESKSATIREQYTRPYPPSIIYETVTHVSISVLVEEHQDSVEEFILVTRQNGVSIQEDNVVKEGVFTRWNITDLAPTTEYIFEASGILIDSVDVLSLPDDTGIVETLVGLVRNLRLANLMPTSMRIVWDHALGSWDSYTVRMEEFFGNNSIACGNETMTITDSFYICDDLIPGTSYVIYVSTNLADRPSNGIVVIDHTPPQPPTNLLVWTETSTTIILNWSLPAQMGDYDGIRIDYEGGSITFDPIMLDTRHPNQIVLDTLEPGTSYEFSVATFTGIESNHRISEALTTTERTFPQEPGIPAILNRTSNQLEVFWTNPVKGTWDTYVIHYEPEDGIMDDYVTVDNHTEVLITGLGIGVVYNVTVSTMWLGYSSEPSSNELQTTPLAASQPANPVVPEETEKDAITVQWEQPAHLNGILQSYNFTYRELQEEKDPGSLQWMIAGAEDIEEVFSASRGMTTVSSVPSLKYTMTGLKSGMVYDITVSAVNDCCDGTKSDVVQDATKVGKAPHVGIYTSGLEARWMQVAWDYPDEDNGRINRYHYEMKDESGNCMESIVYFRIPRPTGTKEQQNVPNPPLEPQVLCQAESLQKVYYWYTTIEHEISDLLPYQNYTFTVTAQNDYGLGEVSNQVFETLQAEPESPPRDMDIKNGTDYPTKALVINWMPPEIPNGVITEYDIQLKNLKNQQITMLQSSTTQLRANDLASHVQYEVTVRSSTHVGAGPWNEKDTVLTAEHYPTRPRALAIKESMPDSFNLTWTEPEPPNGYITAYELKFESQDLFFVNHTGVEYVPLSALGEGNPAFQLQGLVPCVPYYVAISAFTSVGEGPASGQIVGTTTENVIANTVQDVEMISLGTTIINVTWNAPQDETCTIDYVVYLLDSDDELGGWLPEYTTNVDDGQAMELTFEDLRPYWPYQVQIAAVNNAGLGINSSLTQTIRTDQTTPGRVQSITSTMCGKECAVPNTVRLSWQPPHKHHRNGIITQYHLRVYNWKQEEFSYTAYGADPVVREEYQYLYTGLPLETIYFTIVAETEVGESEEPPAVSDLFTVEEQDDGGVEQWVYILCGAVGGVIVLAVVATLVVVAITRRRRGFHNKQIMVQEDTMSTATSSTLDADALSQDAILRPGSFRARSASSSQPVPALQSTSQEHTNTAYNEDDDFYKILT